MHLLKVERNEMSKSNRVECDMNVVKNNALINASYNLELVEQRLILLAIIEARQTGEGINANDPLTIHAESYINQFNVAKQTAYQALKDACDDLFARQFSYQEINKRGNTENVKSRWVSEVRYVDAEATVKIVFAPIVVPLITRLEEHFTSYELEQVAKLKSKYATRLYEILICWRGVGKVPVISLEEIRQKLGILENQYNAMCDFKNNVLELAIKQINQHSDITVSYDQKKAGRKIIGFSFKFKQKKSEKTVNDDRDKNTIDMFYKMTDSQITMYSSKLSRLHEFSHLATANENFDALASKIAKMLQDEKQQKIFKDALKNLGFKANF